MTDAWIAIGVLSVCTAAIKAAGPLALGGRALPDHVSAVTRLVAPSLLASLVVYETFSADGTGLTADARLAGLGAAAVVLALRLPMMAAVVAAAAATALARAAF
jgi:branched-subunit amino acid transport protein AzlD